MDEQEQLIFIRYLVKRLKKSWRELAVHRGLAEMLREQGYQDVDVLLETFRGDPSVQEEMDRQFAWLDKLMPPAEAEIQEKVFLEYLEKWQPDGDPN